MITYEYKCPSCDEEFEQQFSISNCDQDVYCPVCACIAGRHYRTAPSIDTYFEGSTKDQHPVHGI